MVGGFTTRRKKFEEVEKEGLDVRKKDNIIIGADGRRLNSNNKKVIFYYKKPRARKWREVSRIDLEKLGYKFI